MNHGISILFRTIPLAMAAFCFAYGAYIFAAGTDAARLTAGPVVFYLGSICIALYCTAAYAGKRALAICSISDNLVTGKELSADERQTTFTNMMKIALEVAVKMENKE